MYRASFRQISGGHLQAASCPKQQVLLRTGQQGQQVAHSKYCGARLATVSNAATSETKPLTSKQNQDNNLTVLIAGGGIGGLVLAVALLKKGFNVKVLERDVSSIRGEGKLRGPIQVQSNALAALEAIDTELAREMFDAGCITGDRINGLCDGLTGQWYVKFDTFHPAYNKGLPITRVINRMTLQEILTKYVVNLGGSEAILNQSHVVGYREGIDARERKVWAQLEDGSEVMGDLLIGADGINSKVRKQLLGEIPTVYSDYTCYTGISDYVPADIDTVGYRVYLGNCQYFVSSDVGGGKMQWYAFHKEPAGGTDTEGQRKARLLGIFGHWNDMVVDLIKATPEDDVLRRDIYDRPPVFRWSQGRVALLGDSAHAMQPNLGQGGCMAIEDGFEFAELLNEQFALAGRDRRNLNMDRFLSVYWIQRFFRSSTIHGMARMAALMASTYKAYLGEGLGPLSWITKFRIPHPGRVGGRVIMWATMPAILSWVLGGNTWRLDRAIRKRMVRLGKRWLRTEVENYPEVDEVAFARYLINDDALLRASNAQWLLVRTVDIDPDDIYFVKSGRVIGAEPVRFGGESEMEVFREGADFFVRRRRGCPGRVMLNDMLLQSNGIAVRVVPGDHVYAGGDTWVIKQRHLSVCPKGSADQREAVAA